jgi:hypothetical protein
MLLQAIVWFVLGKGKSTIMVKACIPGEVSFATITAGRCGISQEEANLMRYMIPLASALAFAPFLPSSLPVHQDSEKKAPAAALTSPYYPLQVGNAWEYVSGGKKIVVKVTAIEMVDGMSCARLETDASGAVVAELVTVKKDGIYRVRANNQDIKPPFMLLKLDEGQQTPKQGDSWPVDSKVQNFVLKGKLTTGEEKLTVGKTEYDTVSVKSTDMTMGEQSASLEAWYAKDVGMVKQHFRLPAADLDVVLELVKFTPGK